MQITITCPNCQTNLEIAAESMGNDVECPSCKTVITVPRQEPGPGTTIGGFYIKSLIGVGGMGNVFLATQLSMDRDVALKVLSAAVTKDPEDLERFMNEVRVTAKLEHQNIVSAYEAGEDAGYFYMAMAYVNGMPLDQKIQKSNKHFLEEKEALRIIKKIALALSYAWNEYGMLHRDVKPENVLLDTNGEPKLADFGLSRTHQQSKRVTSHGTIMGTPNYMSPEQMDDLANADKRSDIYSLGATLYQALTGKIPFEGSNVLNTFKLIATESLVDPRKYNKSISLQCIKLLEKMLARDPVDRYQTWKGVITDITLILNGKLITTPRLIKGKSVIATITAPPKKINLQQKKTVTPPPSGEKIGIIIATIAVLAVLAFGLIKISAVQKEKNIKRQRIALINARKTALAEKEAILRERYKNVIQYLSDNPDNYSGSVIKLKQALKSGLSGTVYEEKIQAKLAAIVADHDAKVDIVWNTLRQHAQEVFDSGEVDEAIRILRSYTGKYAVEIKEKRYARATELEKYVERQIVSYNKNDKKARQVIDLAFESLADALIAMDFATATVIITNTDSSYFPSKSAAKWKKIKENTTAIINTCGTVASSFRDDIGKTIRVSFKNGKTLEIRVTRVSANTIYASGVAAGSFNINDISEREYFKRLGSRKSSSMDIMRGILSYNAGLHSSAQKYLSNANCPLGDIIAKKTKDLAATQLPNRQQQQKYMLEKNAKRDYYRILKMFRLERTETNPEQTIVFLKSAKYGNLTIQRIKKELRIYNAKYKDTEFAIAHTDVLNAMEICCGNKKEVNAVSLASIDAAIDQLMSDNPDMESRPKVTFGDDQLEITISDSEIKKLDALKELPINRLSIFNGKIESLKPISGMPLEFLELRNCRQLDDISALQGMQLTTLSLAGTGVSNLKPLIGMPLKSLYIGNTKVLRIKALKDMPLELISIRNTNIQDVSILNDIPTLKEIIR